MYLSYSIFLFSDITPQFFFTFSVIMQIFTIMKIYKNFVKVKRLEVKIIINSFQFMIIMTTSNYSNCMECLSHLIIIFLFRIFSSSKKNKDANVHQIRQRKLQREEREKERQKERYREECAPTLSRVQIRSKFLVKSPKPKNKAQRKVDYKNYDAITMSRNYEEKLLQEIISQYINDAENV